MTRAMLPGLTGPVRLIDSLPGIYFDHDPNIERLTAAFDELLGSTWHGLDNFPAYLDPELTPDDFLEMLSAWVGMPYDDNWTDEQARRLVASAVELHRWRGTRRGVAALVEAYTGSVPEISDSGGTSWSSEPASEPPGQDRPTLRVEVELAADADVDQTRFSRLLLDYVPAHVAVNAGLSRLG